MRTIMTTDDTQVAYIEAYEREMQEQAAAAGRS